jgi:hypothetical protein
MLLVDALRHLGALLIPGVGRSCDDSSVLMRWGHAQERNAFANILMQGCAGARPARARVRGPDIASMFASGDWGSREYSHRELAAPKAEAR